MALREPEWEGIVSEFASSLESLHGTAREARGFTEEALEAEDLGVTLLERADVHLRNSERVRTYLEKRIEDDEAKRALGIAAAADMQVAHLLGASVEEPERAFATFQAVQEEFDVNELRADLLGMEPVTGGQTAPPALDEVKQACDEVLTKSGDVGKKLVGNLTAAVTLNQVLDGVDKLVGGSLANVIDEIRGKVGPIKKKVLDFIKEAMTKLARLLGLDPDKIKEQLKDFWDKVKERAKEWAEDALGRSKALEAWQRWLGGQPSPETGQVNAALKLVNETTSSHENQLKWAGRAVNAFGWADDWIARLPQGPLVLVGMAGGLGGWIGWIAWDDLRHVAHAAA